MFKLSVTSMVPALMLIASAAGAQTQHIAEGDTPAVLHAKCMTVGSQEYDGDQCIAFRAAAEREIAACMSKGAANSHGYRALRLICAEAQARRVAPSVD